MTIDTIKEFQKDFKTAAAECGFQNPALLTLLIAGSQVCEELIEAKRWLDKGLEACNEQYDFLKDCHDFTNFTKFSVMGKVATIRKELLGESENDRTE